MLSRTRGVLYYCIFFTMVGTSPNPNPDNSPYEIPAKRIRVEPRAAAEEIRYTALWRKRVLMNDGAHFTQNLRGKWQP